MKTIRVRDTTEEISVGKILCLGRNYVEHAKEMGADIPTHPVVFIKPSTAIIHAGEEIVIPSISHEMHHEVELVVAIAGNGKNIPASQASKYILGYGVGLDMTLRDLQNEAKKQGLPWSVAKGFDTSAPVSDFVPPHLIEKPSELEIRCTVNGVVRQHSRVDRMIFSVEDTLSFISRLFTFERGDLVFMGTPEGVGPVHAGDLITVELIQYETITHPVRSA